MTAESWYVWLVFRYRRDDEDPALFADIMFIGIFSAHQKALDAAYPGCGIICFALDDSIRGLVHLQTEWVK